MIWPLLDPAMWPWGIGMLANCTEERQRINKARMARLAEYSRNRLRELRTETGICYDERTLGTLRLFRTQKQFDGVGKEIEILRHVGVAYEVLDRDGFCRVERALRLPGDETGDCYLFTCALAKMAEALGVVCRSNTGIHHLDSGPVVADAYLVAMGSYSPRLLQPIGIDIPVYPVKGYSLTLPVTDASGAPESTIMDETHRVAVTRLGDRIRVGGTAEIAWYSLNLPAARRSNLNHVVSDLFPTGGNLSRAEFGTALRPMTPDGLTGERYPRAFRRTRR